MFSPSNRCFYKFYKFHRKRSMLESLFKKVVGLKTWNFIKKRLQHSCSPVKFARFLRTLFLTEHFQGCSWKWKDFVVFPFSITMIYLNSLCLSNFHDAIFQYLSQRLFHLLLLLFNLHTKSKILIFVNTKKFNEKFIY